MEQYTNISADALRSYFRKHHEKKYQLVDVRQPKEYTQGHIAGATLLPLGELAARQCELSRDRDIIFY